MQEQEVCPHCAAGLVALKTKRQWVHWTLGAGVAVCKRERLVAAFVNSGPVTVATNGLDF